MRVALLLASTLALAGARPAQERATGPMAALVVEVDGFEDARGMAGIAVWHGPNGFPEGVEHAVRAVYVGIEDGHASATFEGLPAGTYAVTAFHDRNDNRRFDKNWLGIPREAWGVSNNVHPSLRAPTFDEARFELAPDGSQTVRITVN